MHTCKWSDICDSVTESVMSGCTKLFYISWLKKRVSTPITPLNPPLYNVMYIHIAMYTYAYGCSAFSYCFLSIQKGLSALMYATLEPEREILGPTLEQRVNTVKVLVEEKADVNAQNEVSQ